MEERFYQLNHLMAVAYESQKYIETKKLAEENLELATQFSNNWNQSNAIHLSHIYLGLLALEVNNLAEAKYHLIQSGLVSGSPQLNSFGPNMQLAKVLLEKNEQEVVLKFLEDCKQFWKLPFRFFPIRRWTKVINDGAVPEFGVHLYHHTGLEVVGFKK